jgi:transposase
MRSKSPNPKEPAERILKDIRRATRKHYSAENKIRIVLEGLRGEDSIARVVPPGGHCPVDVLRLGEELGT